MSAFYVPDFIYITVMVALGLLSVLIYFFMITIPMLNENAKQLTIACV